MMVMKNLAKEVMRAHEIHDLGQTEEAMALANALVEEFPMESEVWKLRADLYDEGGFTSEAISDLDCALDLSPQERMYLFRRAFDHLQLGHWGEVVADCTRGLEVTAARGCAGLAEDEALKNEYYSDSFLSLRAEALLSLGRKAEAKADLILLNAWEGGMWTNQLRTKGEMLKLCE